jgi:hypothetical protein
MVKQPFHRPRHGGLRAFATIHTHSDMRDAINDTCADEDVMARTIEVCPMACGRCGEACADVTPDTTRIVACARRPARAATPSANRRSARFTEGGSSRMAGMSASRRNGDAAFAVDVTHAVPTDVRSSPPHAANGAPLAGTPPTPTDLAATVDRRSRITATDDHRPIPWNARGTP